MNPEQTLKLRRIHAELSAILAGETTTPAPDAPPTRSSALRAAAALSDAHPDIPFRVDVDDYAKLIIGVYDSTVDDAVRAQRAATLAAHLTIDKIEIHPGDGNVKIQVWTLGQLPGCSEVDITVMLRPDADVEALLAPLRALIPAEPAEDADAEIRRLAELSAAGQEHRTGGAL